MTQTGSTLIDEELSRSIIGAFYEVYNALGFGFVEHVYLMALERELLARGHHVGREVSVRVRYKGHELAQQRLDMVVDERIVVETKAGFELHKAARLQVFNYLRAMNLEVGLLLHFGPRPTFSRFINPLVGKRAASSVHVEPDQTNEPDNNERDNNNYQPKN